jgi:FixJ family two-component response regulator
MASIGNPATILLADDDETLRRLAWRILMQKGFHVLETSDGVEALRDANGQPVDLLLTNCLSIPSRMLKNSLGQNSAFFRFLLSEAEVHFVVGAR